MTVRVLLAGGGTAGHIEPALNTADALRRRCPDIAVTLLGTSRGLETRLVPERGYPLALIPAVPLPRRPSLALAATPVRLVGAIRAAVRVIDESGADVVAGFGGYVALPAYLAARWRHRPIVVHEGNVPAGLANRVGARFADRVAAASDGTGLRRAVRVGMPLRPEITTLDRPARRDSARAAFGLLPDAPTLLVFGGSQGARRLNDAAAAAAGTLAAAGVQVLHLTGARWAESVEAAVRAVLPPGAPPYVVRPYLDRMADGYAAADLALCRAGAMTCAELAVVGLPAVYVPLPIGNGEQRRNAAPLVAAGGGLLVDDAALDAGWIGSQVVPLLGDAERLARMGRASAGYGVRDAADALADLVLAAGRERS